MKRAILSIAVLSFCMAGINAQNCSYAKKASCKGLSSKSCHYSSAALAAAQDDNILSVFDTEDMQTKYLRQNVCSASGAVSFDEVVFEKHSATFVSKKSYNCDYKQCLKNPNCCIKPMGTAKLVFASDGVALESKKKRT